MLFVDSEWNSQKHLTNKQINKSIMTAKKTTVAVTITSDLLCPWCFVGLRKLQQGAELLANSNVSIEPIITWKPFMLRPNIPPEGQLKDGTPASRVGSRLARAGEEVGINFTGLTDRAPNTSMFHATVKYLQDEIRIDPTKVTDFHVDVFEAYFTLGIFPDQEGILKNIYDSTTRQHVKDLYADADMLARLIEEMTEEAMSASRSGTSGVPTFAFDGDAPAFSGAQSSKVFAEVLQQYANAKMHSSMT
jgi:predicted DsbA family dithiol-disulfide isomerase